MRKIVKYGLIGFAVKFAIALPFLQHCAHQHQIKMRMLHEKPKVEQIMKR